MFKNLLVNVIFASKIYFDLISACIESSIPTWPEERGFEVLSPTSIEEAEPWSVAVNQEVSSRQICFKLYAAQRKTESTGDCPVNVFCTFFMISRTFIKTPTIKFGYNDRSYDELTAMKI